MQNRFNRLTSKEWLPFQKSWFRYHDDEKLYKESMLFFCRAEETDEKLFYIGHQYKLVKKLAQEHVIVTTDKYNPKDAYQYVLIDLRADVMAFESIDDYRKKAAGIIDICFKIKDQISNRRFVTVIMPNRYLDGVYQPLAWHLAYQLSSIFSLKDEKIACLQDPIGNEHHLSFFPKDGLFYCLQFRCDELSLKEMPSKNDSLLLGKRSNKNPAYPNEMPCWFILKPQPRKKNEVLHPAKYPEELVKMFLNEFTVEDDNVMDPMSGTGSTLVAALLHKRNAYGTELSPFFADIASQRCQDIIAPPMQSLFDEPIQQSYKLINKDANLITKDDFPALDYIITSPPYWDMLNMKGAENQAKRIEKGLQTNYSDSTEDLGNIADYEQFITQLMDVYFNLIPLLKKGGHMTIIVKNIKKKGRNYPFAWDICRALEGRMTLLPETFWCQDDINLAPYGYGNTFVSNTFHQYCLNFRKE